ncbi:MAG: hypothetical protein HY918_00870 [Candidatus Doudnabacteria bacterium]|nr:hypothetical protein [Candidatus Doudnabacteria bacterium]
MSISNGVNDPIICFGQQPCGFFPKRYLVGKINAARALQKDIGGKIVFFYHDSDADYRETITVMKDLQTDAEVRLNFIQENKLQKKFSPLYLKRIPAGWKEEILKQLPRFLPPAPPYEVNGKPADSLKDIFERVNEKTVADFCLEMYRKMHLLDGMEIVRSSDKDFRLATPDIKGEYFADLPYQGEIVRAKIENNKAALHEGGGKYTYFDLPEKIEKWQINPGKDERFAWMNSVIHCTHYIAGNSEYEYIKREQFPEVKFMKREQIDQPEMAWLSN